MNPKNRRTYLEYVRSKTTTTLLDVLGSPSSFGFAELVAAIHDVQEILYQSRNEALLNDYPEEQQRNQMNRHALPMDLYKGSILGVGGLAFRTQMDRGWRGPNATPRPSNEHIKAALLLGNPTDMGPSMTAARMFVLARDGKADTSRLRSLALAIFAFWNRNYRRDITDVHRYHFTMDMAANFGVSYSPFTPIDKESREKQEAFNLWEARSEFDYDDFEDEYDGL
jgi:hypothetical protein